jgi:hypothetical protein
LLSKTNNVTYSYAGSKPHAMKSTSGGGVFAYDANGNMTSRKTSTNATTYTQVWNADNKLSEVKNGGTTLAQFFYDADGARVKKVESNAIA